MSYHTNWRDLDEWKKQGFTFSTQSNEAVKLYDAATSQFAAFDVDLGQTMQAMREADPDFVMGYVFANGMTLLSTYCRVDTNPELKKDMDTMMGLVAKGNITDQEKLHALALKEWSEGNTAKACLIWEDILIDHPTDMLALKMAHSTYTTLGMYPELRDSVARVFPSWKPHMSSYSYLYGMHAFGLEETGFYHEAEKTAMKGLSLNPRDGWATHARVHVFEMMGRHDEGIEFLSKTVDDWNPAIFLVCDKDADQKDRRLWVRKSLAGHIYWHWGLYHVERGDYETAIDMYDNEVGRRTGTDLMFDLTNASSLLYRLEMQGVDVGDRWTTLLNYWEPHSDDQIWMFQDAHMIMCTLGAKREDLTVKLLESLRNYVRDGSGTNCEVSREVGVPLCEAFELADKGQYAEAVELLKPVRYKVVKVGGSYAQRDVFNLFLINAAMMSSRKDHQRFARRLLAERKSLKQNSPLTDKLFSKAMANHLD